MSLFIDFANTLWSATASGSWIAKITESHSLMSPTEHNSFMTFLAQSRDNIADPTRVYGAMNNVTPLAAGVTGPASGGQWWIYSTYHGPAPSGGGTTPFTSVQGVPRAIFGQLPRPTQDAGRMAWWQALAELENEIAIGWTAQTPATPITATYTDLQWAGIHSDDGAQGIISDAQFPQITGVNESNTVRTLLDNVATGQADLITAVGTYIQRLQQVAGGAASTSAQPIELAVAPLVQQLSAAYTARQSKNTTVAVVGGGLLLGGTAIGAGMR